MQVLSSLLVSRCAVALLAVCALMAAPFSFGQMRLNDKDVEGVMKNLKEDSKDFRSAFDSSIRKSAIRNTSREKDAKNLAEQFEKQADSMWKHFKDHKKADSEVSQVVNTAGQIDRLVYSLNLDNKTTLSWEKARSELHQVTAAFGIQTPYFEAK